MPIYGNYGLYEPFFTDKKADLSFRCLECGNDEYKVDIRLDYEGHIATLILICTQCYNTYNGQYIEDVKDDHLIDRGEYHQFIEFIGKLVENQEIRLYELKKQIRNAVEVSNKLSGQKLLDDYFEVESKENKMDV